jgi:hypothetical protein
MSFRLLTVGVAILPACYFPMHVTCDSMTRKEDIVEKGWLYIPTRRRRNGPKDCIALHNRIHRRRRAGRFCVQPCIIGQQQRAIHANGRRPRERTIVVVVVPLLLGKFFPRLKMSRLGMRVKTLSTTVGAGIFFVKMKRIGNGFVLAINVLQTERLDKIRILGIVFNDAEKLLSVFGPYVNLNVEAKG